MSSVLKLFQTLPSLITVVVKLMEQLCIARFEIFTAVKIQVEVFCVVTLLPPSSQCLRPDDGESKVLRNEGNLPQQYTEL